MGRTEENVKEESTMKKAAAMLWKYLLGGIIPTYVLTFFLMIMSSYITATIVTLPVEKLNLIHDDTPVLSTGMSYLGSIGMWGAILIIYLLFRRQRAYLKKLIRKINKRTVICLIIGLFIGVGLNITCILAAIIHKDIYLYFNDFSILPCIFLLVAVFVQSSSEEVLCRGFVYRRIETFYKMPIVPIIANSLLFAILHLLNPGVTVVSILNIFLCGILFSLLYYYTGNLSLCYTGHMGWNFCQSIIFGLPNSGVVVPYSFMKLEASNARDSFFYNCAFGVEGTEFSVILLSIACIIVIIFGQKKIINNGNKSEEN